MNKNVGLEACWHQLLNTSRHEEMQIHALLANFNSDTYVLYKTELSKYCSLMVLLAIQLLSVFLSTFALITLQAH